MPIEPIVAPGLSRRTGDVDALRIGTTVMTTAMSPTRAGSSATDPLGQIAAVDEALGAILRAGGAGWGDVAKCVFYVDPTAPAALTQHLRAWQPWPGPDTVCRTFVGLKPCDGSLFQIELTAHAGQSRLPITPIGDAGLTVEGVAVAGAVYLSGQAEGGSLASQTQRIYAGFDAALGAGPFGWSDLTRVRQHLADDHADFDEVRQGREAFVPRGRFLSTSVATCPGGSQPAIIVELQAEAGSKAVLTSPEVKETPGTAQVMRRGEIVHFQAQIADDGAEIRHPGDIHGQTRFVLAKLGAMLAVGDLDWSDVIVSRVFCKHAADVRRVREIERELFSHDILAPDHVSRFFDEATLLEIEIAACARE